MKVMLITDTHGNIDLINRLAAECGADACIHCGDIGLFDRGAVETMPSGELEKFIRHAPLSEEEKVQACSLSRQEQVNFVLENALAGNFEDYLSGRKEFAVPVYAVWGNHEDIGVINYLRKTPLHNFLLLDEKTSVMLEDIRVYGLGGDFNKKHLAMAEKLGIPRVANQIKSALWQYEKLVKMLDEFSSEEVRIQVTHCDPRESVFHEALAYRCRASLTLSGHMHRKENMQWSSSGSTDVFGSFAEKYPSPAWQTMLAQNSGIAVKHLNLAPDFPVILEINGTKFNFFPFPPLRKNYFSV